MVVFYEQCKDPSMVETLNFYNLVLLQLKKALFCSEPVCETISIFFFFFMADEVFPKLFSHFFHFVA